MKEIDKDVKDMLDSLKNLDKLVETKKSEIPAFKRKEKGDKDWKVTQADLDKEDAENISSKKGLDKVKDETGIKEGVDPEVLEWMERFNKLKR